MVADRCRSKPWPYYGLRSVWPDVGIKSSPKFSESCQKLSTAVFNLKLSFVKVAQKDVEYLANLYTSIVTQNFQKSLNLVTLLAMINGSVAAAEEEDECLIQLCCAHLLFRIRKNAFLSVKGEPRTNSSNNFFLLKLYFSVTQFLATWATFSVTLQSTAVCAKLYFSYIKYSHRSQYVAF